MLKHNHLAVQGEEARKRKRFTKKIARFVITIGVFGVSIMIVQLLSAIDVDIAGTILQTFPFLLPSARHLLLPFIIAALGFLLNVSVLLFLNAAEASDKSVRTHYETTLSDSVQLQDSSSLLTTNSKDGGTHNRAANVEEESQQKEPIPD